MNDAYGVVSSVGGVTAEGAPVNFNTIAPTINASLSHTPGPLVVGSTAYFTGSASTNGLSLVDYIWDFDDGTGDTGLTASHVYTQDGLYTPSFTAVDVCGYSGSAFGAITINPPTIVVSFSQSTDIIPITGTVYFTDASTTNGPPIVAWEWDFGDGSQPSTTQNPSHTYSERGTFTVTLTVTDTFGYGDSVTLPNAVTIQAPAFTIDKTYDSRAIAGLPVTYTLTFTNGGDVTATNVIITDRVPSEVSWVSGGDYDVATGVVSWLLDSLAIGTSTSVSFNGDLACGGSAVNDEYRVAGSDQGGQSPWGLPVSFDIQAPTITADFSQSDSEINPGDTVVFTNSSSTNGTGLNYHWDFGDGQTSDSGPVVSHTYTKSGNYVVTLTVTDGCDYEAEATGDLLVRFFAYLPVIIKSD